MCETCGGKQAHYGLTHAGSKKQWCSGCAKKQVGETERIDKHKMCEGCGKTRAHYGLTDSGKRQWCADCAKDQEGETERIDACRQAQNVRRLREEAAALRPRHFLPVGVAPCVARVAPENSPMRYMRYMRYMTVT